MPDRKRRTDISGRVQGYMLRCRPQHRIYKDENGETHTLAPNVPVSMNMWASLPTTSTSPTANLRNSSARKSTCLSRAGYTDVADALIKSGEATIKVLDTDSRWFGVTYAQDRPAVVEKFAELHRDGEYPTPRFSQSNKQHIPIKRSPLSALFLFAVDRFSAFRGMSPCPYRHS